MTSLNQRPSEPGVLYGDSGITVTTSDGSRVWFSYAKAAVVWSRLFGYGVDDATFFELECASNENEAPKLAEAV
jgi:hypothetical protein